MARGGQTYRESHSGANGGAAQEDHHIRRFLAGGALSFKDVNMMTLEEMMHEEEELHDHMVYEFGLVSEELTIILDLSAIFFILPFQLLCRYVGARMTGRRFFLTLSD